MIKESKIINPKISTDISLSALTIAFALNEFISSTPNSTLTKVFQKDEKDDFALIEEQYYDQNGNLEKRILLVNDQRLTLFPETSKKFEEFFPQKGRDLKLYTESEKLFKELGFEPEKVKDIYTPMLQDAFNRASEVLFWAMFLERFFKLNTDQNIISFCYTLVRSIDYLSDSKILKRELVKLGSGWRWKIAWTLALLSEIVKRSYEIEEKKGEPSLNDWKKRVQQKAVNSWNDRKKHIEGIKKDSLTLRKKLKTRLNL